MKKYFLGAAALLALTACSNDETVDLNQDGNVITFAVTANNPSRVAPGEGQGVYCNNNKPSEFTVYAAYDGKSYINGDVIKLNGTKYENQEGTRYWPSTGDVTFLAFQNNLGTFNWDAGGTSTVLNFTVPTTVGNQKDFVYARKTQSKSADGQVSLNFRHALSQIVFQAKNTNGQLDVVIDEVKIVNVAGTGTFTFPTADTETNVVDHNQTSETAIASQGTWVLGTANQSFAVAVPAGNQAVHGNSSLVKLTSENESSKEYSNNAMLLLPHSGAATTAWIPDNGAATGTTQTGSYFLVKCSIRNVEAGSGTAGTDDVYLWGASDATEYVAIPASFAWEQGKKYIYTFVFGNGNGGYDPDTDTPTPVLVPIDLTVTVDDFVKGADPEVPMQTN
ncbi:MAG: fimbrillin family protein [Muribaculaceae bacterium]